MVKRSRSTKKDLPDCDILLDGLSDRGKEQIGQWLAQCPVISCEKNAMIIKEGMAAFGLYLIRKGRAKVMQCGDTGKEQIIKIVGPGEILGDDTFFEDQTYGYCVKTLTPMKFQFLDRAQFDAWMHRYPVILFNLNHKLSFEVKALQKRLFEFAFCNAQEKVARVLVELTQTLDEHTENGNWLIDLTRKDIAGLAGISLETVIRILGDFARHGWIRLKRSRITVVDQKSLALLSDHLGFKVLEHAL